MAVLWSVHKFNLAGDCLLKYFYRYERHIKIPKTGAMAFGVFWHRKLERFFEGDPSFQPIKPELFYAPTNTPRNKTPESFASTCRNHWGYAIGNDRRKEDPKKKIRWAYQGEPYVFKDEISTLAPAIYRRMMQEEPPIFTELEFKSIPLRHGDHYHYFRGSIDHVGRRENRLLIRDHKSGNYHQHQYELDHDPQYTVYGMALLHLLGTSERLARRVGIDPEESRHWVGRESEFLSLVAMECHEVRTGELRQTTRTKLHADEIFKKLDGLEAHIEREEYPPERGEYRCNRCFARKSCDEDFAKGVFEQPVQNVLFHDYERPAPPQVKIVQHRLFPGRRKKPSEPPLRG